MEKKELSIGSILDKLQRYCAYQERCIYDVQKKLSSYDLSSKDRDWIIDMLIAYKFIDEERYTHIYVKSKINSYWGINRIIYELSYKKIPQEIIHNAISGVDMDDYREKFEKVAREKIESLKDIDSLGQKSRVYNYLASKGYESSMIMDFLSVK
ncbi:MAG: regulatory protein RecX [Flavobacteriales bacterium]|nr:regulatory protein RecX [Flavobacteriales bacterium]